uniref:Uncharacterized protein n=1 Tax=Anguilla anguilla TaxID=7936 RepID=A0A0E9QSN8_ANGAN
MLHWQDVTQNIMKRNQNVTFAGRYAKHSKTQSKCYICRMLSKTF